MAINSLYPAFVRINYTSAYGVHTMTVPSVPAVVDITKPTGWAFNLRGAAAPVDVELAVNDFVNLLRPFYKAAVKFTDFTVFTMDTPTSPPLPRFSATLSQTGSSVAPGWDKATQLTMTWRTDEFGMFKLVMLDYNTGNDFSKLVDLSLAPNLEALSDYVTANVSWLAGRDGGRPNTFLQAASTLNEKLRRSYKLN